MLIWNNTLLLTEYELTNLNIKKLNIIEICKMTHQTDNMPCYIIHEASFLSLLKMTSDKLFSFMVRVLWYLGVVVFVWNKENQHNRFNKKALYANGAHEHWAMTEHSPFGDKRPPPPYHLQMEVLWEENGRTQVADSERGHVANELHRREEIWVIFCSQRKANTSLSHSALLLQLPHFYVSSPCRVT